MFFLNHHGGNVKLLINANTLLQTLLSDIQRKQLTYVI